VLNNKFWHCAHVPFIVELNPNLNYRGGGCQIGRGNKKDMISLLPVGGCSESGDAYSDMDLGTTTLHPSSKFSNVPFMYCM
jgi:hypothetical protein